MTQTQTFFLEIAQSHLALARKRSRKRFNEAERTKNSLVAIISSACAVEACVNELLSIPLLALEPKNKRQFYSALTEQLLRQSVRQKVQTVAKFVVISKSTKKRLDDLFKIRNRIIHVSPTLVEEKQVPEHLFQNVNAIEIDEELLPTRPALLHHFMAYDYIEMADIAFKTAKDFLGSIDLNKYLSDTTGSSVNARHQ